MLDIDYKLHIPTKQIAEEIKIYEILEGQEHYFMDEYAPDENEYILITCENGCLVVALPKKD